MEMRLIFGQKSANCLLKDPSPYELGGYADGNFFGDPKD